MSGGPRRGVTRAYVGGLICAVAIVSAALTIAVWGLLSLMLAREPVSTPAPAWLAPLLLLIAIGMLAGILWWQALSLLRGRKRLNWSVVISVSGGAYLLWCLAGVLCGLSIEETWLSPFAAALAPIGGLSVMLFWITLARRVYTHRSSPTWPWERRGEGESSWP